MNKHILLLLIVAVITALIWYPRHKPVGSIDYDCSDFPTYAQMYKFYRDNGGPAVDPSHLDGDHDGKPCEH